MLLGICTLQIGRKEANESKSWNDVTLYQTLHCKLLSSKPIFHRMKTLDFLCLGGIGKRKFCACFLFAKTENNERILLNEIFTFYYVYF